MHSFTGAVDLFGSLLPRVRITQHTKPPLCTTTMLLTTQTKQSCSVHGLCQAGIRAQRLATHIVYHQQQPIRASRLVQRVAQLSEVEATPAAVKSAQGTQKASSSTVASHSLKGFEWSSYWYPVHVLESIDPDRPHAVELLGRQLVLWKDGAGAWQCMEDACPHRWVLCMSCNTWPCFHMMLLPPYTAAASL